MIEVANIGRRFYTATFDGTTGAVEGEHGRGLQAIRALAEDLRIEGRRQHAGDGSFQEVIGLGARFPGKALSPWKARIPRADPFRRAPDHAGMFADTRC